MIIIYLDQPPPLSPYQQKKCSRYFLSLQIYVIFDSLIIFQIFIYNSSSFLNNVFQNTLGKQKYWELVPFLIWIKLKHFWYFNKMFLAHKCKRKPKCCFWFAKISKNIKIQKSQTPNHIFCSNFASECFFFKSKHFVDEENLLKDYMKTFLKLFFYF